MPIYDDLEFGKFVRDLPAASEADLASGNNMPIVSPSDTKKMGGENVAKAGDAAKYQSHVETFDVDKTTSEEVIYTVVNPSEFGTKVKVTNTSANSGFFYISVKENETATKYISITQKIDGGASYELEFAGVVGIINIANVNKLSARLDVEIKGLVDGLSRQVDVLDDIVIGSNFSKEAKTSENGNISFRAGDAVFFNLRNTSSSSGYFSLKLKNNGGSIVYDSGIILLAADSNVTREITVIDDVSYFEFTNTNGKTCAFEIRSKNIGEKVNDLISKDSVYSIDGFSRSVSNLSYTAINDGFSVVPTSLNVFADVTFNTKLNLSAGDFAFVRCDVELAKEGFVQVNAYTEATEGYSNILKLKAGEKRTLYFRSGNVANAGVLKVQFAIPIVDNIENGQTITVNKFIVVKNGYNAYRNEQEKRELPKFGFDVNCFVVDCNGGGHFVSINQGVDFIKRAFNNVLRTKPFTLFVKNGLYDGELSPRRTVGYPNAVINKGSNKISIIGESREGVVVQYVNNSVSRCKVLDIGATDGVVANMTIKSLNDGTYVDASAGGHQNCYCIHSDLGTSFDYPYNTELKNLRLVSTCHSPLGAGLQPNQKLVIDGCIFESRSVVGNSNGACYIHAYASGSAEYDDTMSLEVRDSDFRSFDGKVALTMPNVGSSSWAVIKATFAGVRVYSNGINAVDGNVANANIQRESAGNNAKILNKAEY